MHYEKEENKMIERYKQNEIDKLVQILKNDGVIKHFQLCVPMKNR